MPATVAAQIAVCPSVMLEGVAATVTLVTVTLAEGAVTATTAVPDFFESSMEVAVMVSDPEAGGVAGAL